MTRFPWNSKDIRADKDLDKDISDSDLSGPPLEVTQLGEWSTSRRELWCFYLYYVVRFFFFFFACFLSHILSSTEGQQRTLRIQLWPVSIPESPLSRWI
jgi:hypothetical protein